jgi:ketosteroid isomerase-like protein
MDRAEAARTYYRSLDGHDYDALAALLADSFRHERPDRTIDGPERFVAFMREERPQTETSHPIDDLWDDSERVVAQGRLLDADGNVITGFVDIFTFDGPEISRIRTYTDR